MNILIVDDHEEFVRTLAALVVNSSAMPVTVAICFDGLQAVTLAQSQRPAVAFLDIEMPGLNGADAAAAIRLALGDASPLLVAMTGDPDLLTAAALSGLFDRSLRKPVQPGDLLAIANEAAEGLAGPHCDSETRSSPLLPGTLASSAPVSPCVLGGPEEPSLSLKGKFEGSAA
jgi:CheY-like chemotaxis protein